MIAFRPGMKQLRRLWDQWLHRPRAMRKQQSDFVDNLCTVFEKSVKKGANPLILLLISQAH
jgi:hypothetical protein